MAWTLLATHRVSLLDRDSVDVAILGQRILLIAAIRFLWKATSGSRLRPWRSEYLRWRIETYSGVKADQISALDMLRFTWRERGNLLSFLKWTGNLEKQSSGKNQAA
jgi:hypothetical protein